MPSLVMTHCATQELSSWELGKGHRTGGLETWGKLGKAESWTPWDKSPYSLFPHLSD